jgi:hypothetical protein
MRSASVDCSQKVRAAQRATTTKKKLGVSEYEGEGDDPKFMERVELAA